MKRTLLSLLCLALAAGVVGFITAVEFADEARAAAVGNLMCEKPSACDTSGPSCLTSRPCSFKNPGMVRYTEWSGRCKRLGQFTGACCGQFVSRGPCTYPN